MTPPRDPGLYGLLYTSVSDGLSPAELDALLRASRERNARLRVTGALVVLNASVEDEPQQRFVQWLEGPKEAVYSVFDAIAMTERQVSLIVLWKGDRARRLCTGWSMALRYRPLASMVAALDELGLVLDGHLSARSTQDEVDDLILRAVLAPAG